MGLQIQIGYFRLIIRAVGSNPGWLCTKQRDRAATATGFVHCRPRLSSLPAEETGESIQNALPVPYMKCRENRPPSAVRRLPSQRPPHRLSDLRRRFHHVQAALLHDLHFGCRRVVLAADDGAGVAHLPALGRRLAGDEADDGLGAVFLDVIGRFCFHAAADLADHDDAFRFRVVHQQFDRLFGGGAHDGVAADADAGRLPHARLSHLVDCLVGERAGAGNDADLTFFVDEAGHDAALRFARRDDARAVGADQVGVVPLQVSFYPDHVLHRNAFRDADDHLDAGFGGLHDGVGGESRRHKDHRSVGAGLADGVRYRVEYRKPQVLLATFSGGDAAHYIRSILYHLFGVESAFLTGEPLDDHPGVLVDEN